MADAPDGGVAPDTGGLGGGLGGAIGGLGSGLGGGLGDITGGGGASGTAAPGGGMSDITGGPSGGGFMSTVENALSNIDLAGFFGGLFGGLAGGAVAGPVGAVGLGLLGHYGADKAYDAMFGGPSPSSSSTGGGLMSGITSGTPGSAPQGGMAPGESSALLPSSNAAIALGVPTTTPTQNVASTLGVAA